MTTDERTGKLFDGADNGADNGADDAQPLAHAQTVRTAPDPASIPRPTVRTIRSVRRVEPATSAPGPLYPWGATPAKADSWGIERLDVRTGAFVELGHAAPGSRMESKVWPIAELGDAAQAERTIGERWGGGEYRFTWWAMHAKARSGRQFLRRSRSFVVQAEAPAPAAAPAPVAAAPAFSAFPSEVMQGIGMMQAFDALALGKLEQIARMGEVLRPPVAQTNPAELLGPIVQLLVQQQQSADARFERLIAEMRRRDSADDARDDLADAGGASGAAAAVATVAKAAVDPDATFLDGLQRAFTTDPIEAMKQVNAFFGALPQVAAAAREFLPKSTPTPAAPPAPPEPPAPAPRRIAQPRPPTPATHHAHANGSNVVPIDGRELAQREATKGPTS